MKDKPQNDSGCHAGRALDANRAFTLIELLVVVAIVGMLTALLLPALAGAKADTWRAQCQSNLKQLATGFRLFEQDHNEMFPAAGSTGTGQLTWDTYIYRYIGGSAGDFWLSQGVLPIEFSLPIDYCPTDAPGQNMKVVWIGNPPWNGLRSYAMAACGPDSGTDWQVDSQGGKYPLPNIKLGVGIYWRNGGADLNAKSYKTAVVKDPAGAILLVEEPNGQNVAGGIWPCISIGPLGTGSLYQLDPAMPVQSPGGVSGVNQGWHTYQAHGNRFNYLFHDNHVEALTIGQTIGTGTTNSPKGMWTVATGD